MATTQVQTVSTTGDKIKLVGAAALVVAALAAYYLLSKQGVIAQWGGLLLGLGAAVAVFHTANIASDRTAKCTPLRSISAIRSRLA